MKINRNDNPSKRWKTKRQSTVRENLTMSVVKLPSYAALQQALKTVVKEDNGGFALNMWATVVDKDGVVQAVVFSGEDRP